MLVNRFFANYVARLAPDISILYCELKNQSWWFFVDLLCVTRKRKERRLATENVVHEFLQDRIFHENFTPARHRLSSRPTLWPAAHRMAINRDVIGSWGSNAVIQSCVSAANFAPNHVRKHDRPTDLPLARASSRPSSRPRGQYRVPRAPVRVRASSVVVCCGVSSSFRLLGAHSQQACR